MRNTSIQNRKKQAGYSLIEISIALIIVISAAVAAYSLYQQSKASQEAQDAQRQVMGLVAAIKGVYTRPDYSGIEAAKIVRSGRAPSDMIAGTPAAPTLTNVFGGDVTVAAASVGGGTNNGYTITYPGVGTAQCNTVISGLRETFRTIAIGVVTVKSDTTAYNQDTVLAECEDGPVEIIFTGV